MFLLRLSRPQLNTMPRRWINDRPVHVSHVVSRLDMSSTVKPQKAAAAAAGGGGGRRGEGGGRGRGGSGGAEVVRVVEVAGFLQHCQGVPTTKFLAFWTRSPTSASSVPRIPIVHGNHRLKRPWNRFRAKQVCHLHSKRRPPQLRKSSCWCEIHTHFGIPSS